MDPVPFPQDDDCLPLSFYFSDEITLQTLGTKVRSCRVGFQLGWYTTVCRNLKE